MLHPVTLPIWRLVDPTNSYNHFHPPPRVLFPSQIGNSISNCAHRLHHHHPVESVALSARARAAINGEPAAAAVPLRGHGVRDPAPPPARRARVPPPRRYRLQAVFRRRYRAYHQPPPVMGFVLNMREEKDLARLVPTTRYVPKIADQEDLDVRHGRVLLHSFYSDRSDPAFIIWDPITDDYWQAEPPREAEYDSWSATLRCARPNCDHVLDAKPAMTHCNRAYFTTRDSQSRILEYDFGAPQVNFVSPPTIGRVPCQDVTLLPAAGTRLQVATIQLSRVMVWEAQVPLNGTRVAWVPRNLFNLSRPLCLLPDELPGTFAICFCEDLQLLYFTTGKGFHSVNLKSGTVTGVVVSGSFNAVIPFVSSFTADIVQVLLGPRLGN